MLQESAPSLVNWVTGKLRAEILDSVLQPNQKLKVQDLCASYKTSSSPIREALTSISREGLIIADARRGFRVAPISRDDLEGIIELRLLIECDALAKSMKNGSKGWLKKLRAAYLKLEATASDDAQSSITFSEDWADAHKDFHLEALAACPSVRQLEICTNLYDQAERYRRISAKTRAIPRDRRKEHEELFLAIDSGKVDMAQDVLTKHLKLTAVAIGKNLNWDLLNLQLALVK